MKRIDFSTPRATAQCSLTWRSACQCSHRRHSARLCSSQRRSHQRFALSRICQGSLENSPSSCVRLTLRHWLSQTHYTRHMFRSLSPIKNTTFTSFSPPRVTQRRLSSSSATAPLPPNISTISSVSLTIESHLFIPSSLSDNESTTSVVSALQQHASWSPLTLRPE